MNTGHGSRVLVPQLFPFRGLLFALSAFGLVALAPALEWKSRKAELVPRPFQPTVDAVFEFRNASNGPVTIRDIQTNCDCLSAATDRRIYQPGESGRVTAIFTVGDRFGVYERTISVVTDETGIGPIKLAVRTDVPELAELSPRTLEWTTGSTAKEKIIQITPARGLSIMFNRAESTNDSFTVSLDEIEPGAHYRLRITPKSTVPKANAAIRVHGRDKEGHEIVVSAYADVH